MVKISKILTDNYIGEQYNKKQIILSNSHRDAKNYLASLEFRMNSKNTKVPHYLIDKEGNITQLMENDWFSSYISDPDVNKNSINICLENLGWLEKVPLKSYYVNWIGDIYNGTIFERKWRDYFFWDPYTEEQMNSLSELCDKICEDTGINNKTTGHNTKMNGVQKFSGIVSLSNYSEKFLDVNPSFKFEKLKNKI
jgi:N-acetyl-anhydromuramyl-L-alanine amidase AmpD